MSGDQALQISITVGKLGVKIADEKYNIFNKPNHYDRIKFEKFISYQIAKITKLSESLINVDSYGFPDEKYKVNMSITIESSVQGLNCVKYNNDILDFFIETFDEHQVDYNWAVVTIITFDNKVHIKFPYVRLYFKEKQSIAGIGSCIQTSNIAISDSRLITDSVLGLLKIKDLTILKTGIRDKWFDIIDSYIELDYKNILKCQKDLISVGLKDYAKL